LNVLRIEQTLIQIML